VRVQNLFVPAFVCLISLEVPAQAPPQKPAAKPPAVQASEAVPAPTSKHYPILIIAHGSEPFWSLRLGMKGPERLDRTGYPPMVLEPGETTREESGSSWTYKAKDGATGANVAVKLTREPCSDNLSETKYTFSVIVDHAQVGSLKGCGLSSPDKFPEFRKRISSTRTTTQATRIKIRIRIRIKTKRPCLTRSPIFIRLRRWPTWMPQGA